MASRNKTYLDRARDVSFLNADDIHMQLRAIDNNQYLRQDKQRGGKENSAHGPIIANTFEQQLDTPAHDSWPSLC